LAQYNTGLFILDLDKVPWGCGEFPTLPPKKIDCSSFASSRLARVLVCACIQVQMRTRTLTTGIRLLGNGPWPNVRISLLIPELPILTNDYSPGKLTSSKECMTTSTTKLPITLPLVRPERRVLGRFSSDPVADCLLDLNVSVSGTIHVRSPLWCFNSSVSTPFPPDTERPTEPRL
jgi:hypothetical protein